MATRTRKLKSEIVGGEPYHYVPLGKYVVSAPAVCRGRPTFKYTRIEVAGVLESLAGGFPLDELLRNYKGRVTQAGIVEATRLAAEALSLNARSARAVQ